MCGLLLLIYLDRGEGVAGVAEASIAEASIAESGVGESGGVGESVGEDGGGGGGLSLLLIGGPLPPGLTLLQNISLIG